MSKKELFVRTINNLTGVKRSGALCICAIVAALPFHLPQFSVCTFLGLSGLLLIVLNDSMTRGRVLGSLFCFFYVYYFFGYSWFISLYPLDFAGLSDIESVGVILCATVLIPLIHAVIMTLPVYASYLCTRHINNRCLSALLFAFGFVVGEFLQSIGTFAFPWLPLYLAQSKYLFFLQSASLFGARVITVIIVTSCALFATSLREKQKRHSKKYALFAIVILLSNSVFGVARLAICDFEDNEKITAALLQGNLSSSEKWQGGTDSAGEIYLELAKAAARYAKTDDKTIDVALIPETAFPSTIYEGLDTPAKQYSLQLAKETACPVIVGAFSKRDNKSYNSLFAFAPDGEMSYEIYDKTNLVPFGEFLPYRSLLERIVPAFADMNMFSSDITPGGQKRTLDIGDYKAACLICFDSIFPQNSRLGVRQGGDFIAVSTNDSWYKQSAALTHHKNHAVMRAIENKRSVIRSANTGISAIIDPCGRILCRTNVNEKAFAVEKIPICKAFTLYTLTGDLVLPISFLMMVIALIYSLHKKISLPKK